MAKAAHFKRALITIFTALIILAAFAFSGNRVKAAVLKDDEYQDTNTGYKALIVDEADVLSESEESDLLEHMMPYTPYGNALFVTVDDSSYDNAEMAAADKYYGYFGETNGVSFVIDYYNSEYRLDNWGDFTFGIDESALDRILDNAYEYMSTGDAAKTAEYAFDEHYKTIDFAAVTEYANTDTTGESDETVRSDVEPVVKKNSETGYEVCIIDDADLLSDGDEKRIMEEMYPITQYAHAVFFSSTVNYGSWEQKAKDKLVELYGSNTVSATIFYIDMANRQLTCAATGDDVTPYLTGSKCDSITDNVYRDASKGDYYSCAAEAYREMFTILDGGKIAEPMRIVSNVFLSIVIGLLVAYGIVKGFTAVHVASEKELLAAINVQQRLNNYTCVFTHQTRVYDPPSSSSSGGGGGGGGGGGSSSSGSHGF